MSDSNLELARRGWEAIGRGDLEAIEELLDPDVKWHGGDPSFGCQNRKQTLQRMRQARARQPQAEVVEMLDAGDRVVVILRRIGEDGEPELVANLTTFRDGKVVEMVHYPDPCDARVAAGL